MTIRLADERVITTTTAARRVAARVLLSCGKARRLLAFRIADTHAHALLACARSEAGIFARAAEVALRFALQLPVPFEAARVRPVMDQRHLGNSFRYILRQEERHGIAADPLHDGSSLPDLLGLRVVGAYLQPLVAAHLPRLRSDELHALLGAPDLDAHPVDLADLADSSAAAFALPSPSGKSRAHRLAQSIAVQIAERAGTRQLGTARLMGVSARTVRRFRVSPIHEALELTAVLRQMRLRSVLRARQPDGQAIF